MAKYVKADIRHTIREDDFNKILNGTPDFRDRLFLSLLFCTGARPSEISGNKETGFKGMTWGSIIIDDQKGEILFKIPISKIRKGAYAAKERKLILTVDRDNLDLPTKVIIETYAYHLKKLKHRKLDFDPEEEIFDFSRKTGYNIVSKASKIIGVDICPYNFRHSRLTLLAEKGAGIETLLHFKGSSDPKSIAPYLQVKEVRYKL